MGDRFMRHSKQQAAGRCFIENQICGKQQFIVSAVAAWNLIPVAGLISADLSLPQLQCFLPLQSGRSDCEQVRPFTAAQVCLLEAHCVTNACCSCGTPKSCRPYKLRRGESPLSESFVSQMHDVQTASFM